MDHLTGSISWDQPVFMLFLILFVLPWSIRGFSTRANTHRCCGNRRREMTIFLAEDDSPAPTDSKILSVFDSTWIQNNFNGTIFSAPSIIFGGFLGILVSISLNFLPIPYGSASTLVNNDVEEHALLFDDILYDLTNDYIDEVNINQLFETAVNAMLKTLDPYTQFENRKDAESFQESVQGRYGGVGLVISSPRQKSNLLPTVPLKTSSPISIPSDKIPSIPSSAQPIDSADPSSPSMNNPSSLPSTQKNKEVSSGVMVVDAFEGYAYDAGIRIGDRILAIDDNDVTQLSVDQVSIVRSNGLYPKLRSCYIFIYIF